jgi:DNA topoisomerase-1
VPSKSERKKPLIIVESPTKVRTLKNFLGSGYDIAASMGHIRDLPKTTLGVDVENDFEPTYRPIPEKRETIRKLKAAVSSHGDIYLASDPDREGEAIAWHIAEQLKLEKRAKRIQFNEITTHAVRRALEHPTEIDASRVLAQQARRILDRLVGYKLSPLLWKKVRPHLSAGRVQSVALRLVVDREREIEAFVPEEYWVIGAKLTPDDDSNAFLAALVARDGHKFKPQNEQEAKAAAAEIRQTDSFVVAEVKKRRIKRSPSPPFITSTLQQDAYRRLGYPAKKTMAVAQALYEGVDIPSEGQVGLITYMRTDSVRLSNEAIGAARSFITTQFGESYLPNKPNAYRSKRRVQDAHEAIRPTDVRRTPESVKQFITADQFKLYSLVWKRFVACQMNPAVLDVTTVDIDCGRYGFRASGSVMVFDGFTRVYGEAKANDRQNGAESSEGKLPPLKEGDDLRLLDLTCEQKFTQPPARYTEATLVKALEERGIGRPSTYATIISTIKDRRYVEAAERKLKPTELGTVVTDFLVKHFPRILDVDFTATVEEDLDTIERGKLLWTDLLRGFYDPFSKKLEETEKNAERVRIEPKETDHLCPNCGKKLVIREGRYGKFLGCSGFPECKTIVKMTDVQDGSGQGPKEPPQETDEVCPNCGSKMVIRQSRHGKFLGCSAYPKCRTTKPLASEESGPPVKCPEPGCTGQLVLKQSKRGRKFYGCNRYPECKFATWDKPLPEKCPACGWILVEKRKRGAPPVKACAAPDCDYEEEIAELQAVG